MLWVSCSAYAEASADTVVTFFAFLPAGRQACTVTLRSAQGFWLKYEDSARCYRRVTQTPFIAEPVSGNFLQHQNLLDIKT